MNSTCFQSRYKSSRSCRKNYSLLLRKTFAYVFEFVDNLSEFVDISLQYFMITDFIIAEFDVQISINADVVFCL